MGKIVKIGMVGLGSISKTYLKTFEKVNNAKLVAICCRSAEKLHSKARELGVRGYSTIEEMIQNPEIDVIAILTPPYTHAEIGIKAAEAGKHVLVEKPIDVDEKKAKALIKACEKKGVKLSVISQMRFGKAVNKAKGLINSGKLGKLLLIRTSMKWHRNKDYFYSKKWRMDPEKAGGGVLMNQAIHFVDLVRWFGGPYTKVHSFKNNLKYNLLTEDTIVGTIKFKSGALGVIEATTATCRNLPEIIELHGTNGSIVIKNNKLVEYHFGNYSFLNRIKSKIYSKAISFVPLKKGHIANQIDDFVSTIKENKPCLVNGSEGLETLKLCKRLYEGVK